MALYLEKISENEEKIAKLDDVIKRSTAKKKKLMDENARLTYMALCEQFNSSGRELIEILTNKNNIAPKNSESEIVSAEDDEEQICFYDENEDSMFD